MPNEIQLEEAENWYNAHSKEYLVEWATNNKLDIGQENDFLDADWNERVIQAKAAQL